MELSYTVPLNSLNAGFLDTIKANFAGKDVVNIIVKDTDVVIDDDKVAQQMASFRKMDKLREKLKGVKVDPNLDLSALANEVNL